VDLSNININLNYKDRLNKYISFSKDNKVNNKNISNEADTTAMVKEYSEKINYLTGNYRLKHIAFTLHIYIKITNLLVVYNLALYYKN